MKILVVLHVLLQFVFLHFGIINYFENSNHIAFSNKLIENSNIPDIDSVSINNDTLKYTIMFSYKSYKYKFISYYRKQKISKYEKDIRNPPRISQNLIISFLNSENKLDLPLNIKREKLLNGKEISIVDVRIDQIVFYEVNGLIFFYLSGSGGCMDCNGFEGLFSLEGEKIEFYYYNKRVVIDSFHSKDDKFKGIDITKLPKNPLYKLSLDFQIIEDF